MSKEKHAEKKHAHRKGDGKHQSKTPKPDVTKLPMAAPNMRIGLLGGSFNPPHDAHRAISLTALKRLGLDQVWWLVTPGNPLKDAARLPSLESRVEAARDLAKHPRIAVTGFEAGSGSAYTVDLARRAQAALSRGELRVADGRRQSRAIPSLARLGGDFRRRADRGAGSARVQAEGARRQGGTALRRLPGRRIRCARAGAARASRLDHPHPYALAAFLDRTSRQEG